MFTHNSACAYICCIVVGLAVFLPPEPNKKVCHRSSIHFKDILSVNQQKPLDVDVFFH